MDNLSENRGRSGGRRAVIALASCVFGAGLILLASQMGSKSVDKTGTTEEESSVKVQKKKPSALGILLLGNVVVVSTGSWLLQSAKALQGRRRLKKLDLCTRLKTQLQYSKRAGFSFSDLTEDSSSVVLVLSTDLEPICDANRINAAPKTQLASAITALRPPDRPLFSDKLSIKDLPRFVEGRKTSNFYTVLIPASSRENDVSAEKALSVIGHICLKLAVFLR